MLDSECENPKQIYIWEQIYLYLPIVYAFQLYTTHSFVNLFYDLSIYSSIYALGSYMCPYVNKPVIAVDRRMALHIHAGDS